MDYLEFIVKIQSIAKIGLKFSSDPYALENYHELEELSKKALESYTDNTLIHDNYFVKDIYPTPNISVRVIVESQEKILFVRERKEQEYSLPGGWCDVFKNARENAVAEVLQESGFEVEIERLIAVFNRNEYTQEKSSVSEYCIYFSARIVGGSARISHETDDVQFFDETELPVLSHKNTFKELNIAFDIYYNSGKVHFD